VQNGVTVQIKKPLMNADKTLIEIPRSIGHWDLVIGIWSLGFGHWDLVIGIWSLGFGHWDLVIGHLKIKTTPAAHEQRSRCGTGGFLLPC